MFDWKGILRTIMILVPFGAIVLLLWWVWCDEQR